MICPTWPKTVLAVGLVSLVETIFHAIVISIQDWERVTYNITYLKSLPNYCFQPIGNDSGILWPTVLNTSSNLRLCGRTQGTIIVPEHGGVWEYCQDPDSSVWDTIVTICDKPRSKCNSYLEEDPNHTCCIKCQQSHTHVDPELTVGGVMKTAISSVIVSIILQLVSWTNAAIGVCRQNVSITMLAGVTFLLSGTFLSFAVTIEHYKISSVMNQKGYSLTPLPDPVAHVSRNAAINWGVGVAWASVVYSVFVCVVWVQLSKQMGLGTWKQEDGELFSMNLCSPVRRRTKRKVAAGAEANQNGHVTMASEI